MKMTKKLIASFLCAGALASVSALADETAAPQGNVGGPAVEQLKQDKATVKADRQQLKNDKKKLREDRVKLGRKGRKHRKNKEQQQQPATEQPKS